MTELQEHVQVAKYIKEKYPEVIFLSTLNGVRMPIGLAVQCAAIQSGRGLPDIIILEAKGKFHGLCIELKRSGEKLFKKDGVTFITPHVAEQDQVLQRLAKKGYYTTFSIGFIAAKTVIDLYMNNL